MEETETIMLGGMRDASRSDDERARAADVRVRVFDSLHPSVVVVYSVLSLVFIMAAFQPVLVGIALFAALLTKGLLSGRRAVLKSLRWQIPLLLIVAVANPLFSSQGSTELFRIGVRAVYFESFAYGLCMGAMLLAVMIQFVNASAVLTSDRVMSVMGNRFPTIALMVSMTARLVPRFVQRGHEVQTVHNACSVAASAQAGSKVRELSRIVSVIMGWGMEDSLETADAMRSRGWGSAAKRTVYRRHAAMTRRDAALMALMLVLGAICVLVAVLATSQYKFYPQLSRLTFWWGYIPYAAFFLLPSVALIGDRFSWTR